MWFNMHKASNNPSALTTAAKTVREVLLQVLGTGFQGRVKPTERQKWKEIIIIFKNTQGSTRKNSLTMPRTEKNSESK